LHNRIGAPRTRQHVRGDVAGERSADDRIHDLGQLAAGFGEGVEIVFTRTARLDQPAMTQKREVMAYGGLALGPEIATELGDISLFFAQEHEHLKASRIRDLLQ
jgi:hypothetical protein